MPVESFRSLQDDWKLEIQEMFDQLRTKEKVELVEWKNMQLSLRLICNDIYRYAQQSALGSCFYG